MKKIKLNISAQPKKQSKKLKQRRYTARKTTNSSYIQSEETILNGNIDSQINEQVNRFRADILREQVNQQQFAQLINESKIMNSTEHDLGFIKSRQILREEE